MSHSLQRGGNGQQSPKLMLRRKKANGNGGDGGEPPSQPQNHLIEEPPEPVQAAFQKLLDPDEKPQVIAASDLTPEGQFGESWLFATEKRVVLVNPNGRCPDVTELPLCKVKEVKKEDYVGSGRLRLITEDSAHEICFSLTHTDKFTDVKDLLDTLTKRASGDGERGTEVTPEALQARAEQRAKQKGRCPKCGRVLPRWSNVCVHCIKKTQLILRLFGYLKPYWHLALFNFILMFVITGISLYPPILTQILIDDVLEPSRTPERKLHLLFLVVLGIVAISAASSVLGSLRSYMLTWLQGKIVLGLRTELYEHLHRLSLTFYDRRSTGQIMHRLMHDTSNLHTFIANDLQQIISDLMTAIIICGYMFHKNWQLALITLGPVPFIVWGTNRFGHKIYRVYHKLWRRWSKLSAVIADTIPGVRVVKAFTQESREVERFNEMNDELFRTNMTIAKMSRFFYPFMGFLTTLSVVTIWAYGGYLVITSGTLTAGVLLAFIQYLHRFYAPINNLSAMNDRLQNVTASAERVFELLDSRPDIEDAPDAIELPNIQGQVNFQNVTFGYDPATKVLQNISFEVQPGEMIGLVGHSGAGKTTLINLLCRFYDVNDGAILIDGHDIRKVKLKSLRNQIGVVLQEPYLFHGTIAENIAYGNPKAKPEQILASAIAANAHEFILKLPDGYDSMVGERGTGLSGGEKQRISIARAILKNPRILILDEATSSVDTEAEVKIREAMERLIHGRTTFVIAHRFSTLRSADRLIVLEKGKIVEMGTHEELLSKEGGTFKKLWDMQMDIAKRKADLIEV